MARRWHLNPAVSCFNVPTLGGGRSSAGVPQVHVMEIDIAARRTSAALERHRHRRRRRAPYVPKEDVAYLHTRRCLTIRNVIAIEMLDRSAVSKIVWCT
ncbi:hypothetical protein B296_00012857 [Ensete ventricosum]|uniref:Uncharacterized protein n=1 Tax=Ensete ventricosum TaxID=4639 RepID=A0A427AV05_ENSVE|nr:hypothetical protein B296_00012857 [Ensete ventricosum]